MSGFGLGIFLCSWEVLHFGLLPDIIDAPLLDLLSRSGAELCIKLFSSDQVHTASVTSSELSSRLLISILGLFGGGHCLRASYSKSLRVFG